MVSLANAAPPLTLLFAGVVLTGCATAIRGSDENLSVVTVPEGAAVTTDIAGPDGEPLGCAPTPCSIGLSRRSSPRVTVSLPGYKPVAYQVVSSAMTSNIATPEGTLIAGLPQVSSYVVAGRAQGADALATGGASLASGLLTLGTTTLLDVGTGATLSLSPNPVTVYLMEEEAAE